EEMDAADFANRIRSLPRGEWVASLPSPTFGETGPYPFSLEPLPIPPGHPESDHPLDDQEEKRFKTSLSTIHKRASDEFGVLEQGGASSEQSPEAIQEILGTPSQDLDQALAKTIRIIQLRDGVRDENGWVSVEDVDAELRSYFEGIDSDPPEYDVLADIRKRSRLLDVDLDTAADELVVRLTDVGETAAAPDTGDTRAAGSEAHDAALLETEAALTTLGFRVTILTQDGNEQPDAKATHPDLDEIFAIEAETTTPENPVKVLTNLRKAQDAEHVPLFVVRPGETETYWAERVEQILSPPVQQLANGETRFYTHDRHITFNGGATEQGGVTAVRPAAGETDTRRTVWTREDDQLVLKDGDETEYPRLSSLADASKDRIPAIYSYDHAAGEYVVYEHGEQHIYDTKVEFEADWVRIKKPFVPANELPVPEYQRSTYGIVILRDDGESIVYEDGVTKPLSTLVDDTIHSVSADPECEQRDDEPAAQPVETGREVSAEKTDISFASFVDTYLIEDGETALPKDEVYAVYTDWAAEHDVDPVNKSWFSRKLGDHIEFETVRERRDGELVRCYSGFCFAPRQETGS
ncbi:conjugation protein, partial [Halogeometricum pallidum JCM 14848]